MLGQGRSGRIRWDGGAWLGGLRKGRGEGGRNGRRNGVKETKADEKLFSFFFFKKVSMILKKKNTLVFQRKVYVFK